MATASWGTTGREGIMGARVHVVIVNYVFEPSSAPAALLDAYASLSGWAEAVTAAGARVTVLQRFHSDADLRRGEVDYVFRADASGAVPRVWTVPVRLHRIAAEKCAAIVHVNGLLFPEQTWVLRRSLPRNVRLVLQDHATVPPAQHVSLLGRAKRQRWTLGIRSADALLFSVDEHAQPWRDAGMLARHQPVYEIMEASRNVRRTPRAQARQATGLPGAPALVWVGRLDANKDPLTVLDGFERALKAMPAAHLSMFFREGALVETIRDRVAASADLSRHVHLRGFVPEKDVHAALSACDIFVLGSHREGSGYALIEALACGAVPVVTDIPSFRRLTKDGSLGALWPPGRADVLATALLDIQRKNPASLCAAVASHFDAEISWAAIGRRAVAVYEEVAASRQ